jgi:hypothetical protein
MWIAAAFAVVCTLLALLSASGFIGDTEDAAMLALMAAAGIVILVVSRFIIGRPSM